MTYVPNHKYYLSSFFRNSLSWLMDQIPLFRNLRVHLDSFPRCPPPPDSSSLWHISSPPSDPSPQLSRPFVHLRSSSPLPKIILPVSHLPRLPWVWLCSNGCFSSQLPKHQWDHALLILSKQDTQVKSSPPALKRESQSLTSCPGSLNKKPGS